jgi:hypothetical protein
MIVTTGKIVKVETLQFEFERSCETPGAVSVWRKRYEGKLVLPGNLEEAEVFCEAYMRIVREEIEYRKRECE